MQYEIHIQETRIIPVLLYAIDFPALYQATEENGKTFIR